MLNLEAPIIPYQGMGGIKLYSKLDNMQDILSKGNVKSQIINNSWIRYDIDDSIELFFHLSNKKLFKITTLDGYRGKLFNKISVGMSIEELLKIEPSFVYDDFEEVFESNKGVFIETDVQSNKVRWISIYIKELDTEDFDNGNW